MANPKRALLDIMGDFATSYRKVEAAKSVVSDLEKSAGIPGDEVVRAYGKGPHAMALPQPDGTTKIVLVTFQKVNHAVRWHLSDPSAIPGLTVTYAPPPAAPAQPPPAP